MKMEAKRGKKMNEDKKWIKTTYRVEGKRNKKEKSSEGNIKITKTNEK